jgi:hypothetical protein
MTLLFMDGFAMGDFQSKWLCSTDTVSVGTTNSRITGGYSAYASTANIVRGFLASPEIFVGVALRYTSGATNGGTSTHIGLLADTGITTHLSLRRNAIGTLSLYRGTSGGVLLATGTTLISDNAWYYVEIRATINDTTGICQVRLNGSGVNEIDFTGDTKNAGTSTSFDALRLSIPYSATRVTDVYILNTAGSTNNSWLGDVAVRTSRPSGNGTTSQLVGSDADSTDNYLHIDEAPVSSTDYVGSPTAGEKDTYAMGDLPAGISTIFGVAWNGYVAKSDAGAITAAPVIRSGGTDYVGSSMSLPTAYATQQVVYETDPDTATDWTATGVNDMEAGFQVTA